MAPARQGVEMKRTHFKTCPTCGSEFQTTNMRKQYCNVRCTPSYQRAQAFYKDIKVKLPSGTVGTCGELLAAHDLLLRGYFVFRSMTPNSPVDLIILNGKKVYTVEVKSGYMKADGTISSPSAAHTHNCDILAICEQHKRRIFYKGLKGSLPERLQSEK